MISWIQNYIIRKGRVVALSLLVMVIFAFVFTIGNTPGCTSNQSGYQEQLFYGIDLNAPHERETIVQKVSLSAMLNGQQIRSDDQFQLALMGRIALLAIANETGIPAPTAESLSEFIQAKPIFHGQDGTFSTDVYTSFVDSVESNPRYPQGFLIAVLNEDFRIQQVQAALSGPGYMLPSEVIAQARSSQTEYKLSVATIAYGDFAPEINPSEEDLLSFFEENQQRYEIPERVEASYIAFSKDDYVAQVSEATDADLRQHFAEERTRFVDAYNAANPVAEGEEEAPVTFDLVRDAVATSYADSQAMRLANEAAQAFAYQLYYESIDLDSAAFQSLLDASSLELVEIEPYTYAQTRQRNLSTQMLESAFNLSGGRYYSDAYELENAFGVLIYKGRIDPEIPPYETVAAQVTADYLAEEKRSLFNDKGETLRAELEAALEEEKSFVEAAESLELSVQDFEPFTPETAPQDLNRSALNQAQSMAVETVSPMLNVGGTGILVYLESKTIPEIDANSEDLEQSKAMLQRWAAFTSQSDLVNQLIVRGLPDDPEAEVTE